MTDSRERVVEAAASLFLGGSFHRTGIAEICEVAGVNKGTFYHFFPSKLELLMEVLERYATACVRDFTQVAQSGVPAATKIRNIFDVPRDRNSAWKEAYGVSSGCFIGNIILEMAAYEPAVRAKAQQLLIDITQSLNPIVAEFIEADDAETERINMAATVLMGLIQGAQVQAKVSNDPSLFARYAELAPGLIGSLKQPPALVPTGVLVGAQG